MKILKLIWCGLSVPLILAAVQVAAAQGKACMTANAEGQTVDGRLSVSRYEDAAGRRQSAYILLLSRPACLEADEADDRVDKSGKIHVFSSNDDIHRSLQSMIGKSVRVHGRPGAAHTVHHRAPIIMDITKINTN